jgi:hypothetical protein
VGEQQSLWLGRRKDFKSQIEARETARKPWNQSATGPGWATQG